MALSTQIRLHFDRQLSLKAVIQNVRKTILWQTENGQEQADPAVASLARSAIENLRTTSFLIKRYIWCVGV